MDHKWRQNMVRTKKKKVAHDVQPSDVLATLYFNIAIAAVKN